MGVGLRVRDVDEGRHSEVIVKQRDLAGSRPVDNDERERGSDRKHAVGLDDGYVVAAEITNMKGERGG
jgi:hypothetical protein